MTRVVSAQARRIYARLLRRHGSACAGYADQMLATFDALLAQAETKGTTTVLRLLVREAAGILRTRQPASASPRPRGRRSSMNQIAQVTQQTATGTREAAASVSDMATLAEELRHSVSAFKLTAQDERTISKTVRGLRIDDLLRLPETAGV